MQESSSCANMPRHCVLGVLVQLRFPFKGRRTVPANTAISAHLYISSGGLSSGNRAKQIRHRKSSRQDSQKRVSPGNTAVECKAPHRISSLHLRIPRTK